MNLGTHVPDFTEWFDGDVPPKHRGKYQVRNHPQVHHNSKWKLSGVDERYWNGKIWLIYQGSTPGTGTASIFNKHASHQWRGQTYCSYSRQLMLAPYCSEAKS